MLVHSSSMGQRSCLSFCCLAAQVDTFEAVKVKVGGLLGELAPKLPQLKA